LLNFVVSNCVWKNGELTADLRQPFDMLAATTESVARVEAAAGAKTANFEEWLLR
jgi:site-specific DNA recombinase